MEMTTNEIVRMYKEAADKKKQITILSQMNLCTPEEIREELIKGGVDPRCLPRNRKKNEAAISEPDDAQKPGNMADDEVDALIKEALVNYRPSLEKQLKEIEAAAAPLARKVALIDQILKGGETK